MIADWLCRFFGHRTLLLDGKQAWWCTRCRRLWPLGPLVTGLLVALVLSGCAGARPQVDPLRATATALSLAAVAITAESRRADADVEADYRARVSRCPEAPQEREHCKALAREQVLASHRPRITVLKTATELQHRAADAADLADACRRGGQPCEEAKAREAKAVLDEIGALLAGLQGSKAP